MNNLREVVLDTETTGLSAKDGHRIIEIGCVELINRVKTGKTFHAYINPQRPVAPNAFEVHGISDEFLADKPLFKSVVSSFLNFIGNSSLIIHNALFDMQFLNNELAIMAFPTLPMHRAIDTLVIAKKKFPGSQYSLDALCRRFNISLHTREKHSALVDSELLAMVYLRMLAPEQSIMQLRARSDYSAHEQNTGRTGTRHKRQFKVSDLELSEHRELLSKIKNHIYGSD